VLVEESSSFKVEVTVITTGVLEARPASDELIVIALDETVYQAVAASVGLYVSVSVGVEQAASGIATV